MGWTSLNTNMVPKIFYITQEFLPQIEQIASLTTRSQRMSRVGEARIAG